MQLWRIPLTVEAGAAIELAKCLSPDERLRAERFRAERDHRRFIAGRGALRAILGDELRIAPEHIRFAYGSHGKPCLDPALGVPELRFNLSHSDDLALLALTHHGEVGVDLERIRDDRATDAIACRFFSRAECMALSALPANEQTDAFFAIWARKEAYLKARGEGLHFPLGAFTVSLGQPAALLEVEGEPDEIDRWRLEALDVGPGFAAALAAERCAPSPVWRDWTGVRGVPARRAVP